MRACSTNATNCHTTKIAISPSSVPLMGRETKVPKPPRLSSIARRKFSSSIGPRMKPSMSGAASSSSRMNM
ncbi:hypothetical protein D3C84_1297380 [compost metagenome]